MRKLIWKLRILNYIQIFQKLMTQVPLMENGIKQRYIVQPSKTLSLDGKLSREILLNHGGTWPVMYMLYWIVFI